MIAFVDKLTSKMAKFLLNFSAFFAYPLLIVIVLVDVTLRTALNSPLPWGNEVSGLLLILCFFGPACICEEEKSNIALDFLSAHFSELGQILLYLVSSLIAGVWIGLLAYRNFVEIPEMIKYGETGVEFQYPLWPLRLFLAIALLFLFIRLCLNLVILGRKLGRRG